MISRKAFLYVSFSEILTQEHFFPEQQSLNNSYVNTLVPGQKCHICFNMIHFEKSLRQTIVAIRYLINIVIF